MPLLTTVLSQTCTPLDPGAGCHGTTLASSSFTVISFPASPSLFKVTLTNPQIIHGYICDDMHIRLISIYVNIYGRRNKGMLSNCLKDFRKVEIVDAKSIY
jgi:hypothetical protein